MLGSRTFLEGAGAAGKKSIGSPSHSTYLEGAGAYEKKVPAPQHWSYQNTSKTGLSIPLLIIIKIMYFLLLSKSYATKTFRSMINIMIDNS